MRRQGFSLIELMIVSAIVGVLAMIAVPKFADLVRKSKEAAILGHLGSLRSAWKLYYVDTEGVTPQCTNGGLPCDADFLVGRYLDEIPFIDVPRYPGHRGNGFYNPMGANSHYAVPTVVVNEFFLTFGGVWVAGVPGIWINCVHTDAKGRGWSLY